MSDLFSPPDPEKPKPPIQRDVAREEADKRDITNRRKGRAANILFGSQARRTGTASAALGG